MNDVDGSRAKAKNNKSKVAGSWQDVAIQVTRIAGRVVVDGKRNLLANLQKFPHSERSGLYKFEVGPLSLRRLRLHYTFMGFVTLSLLVGGVAYVSRPGVREIIRETIREIIVKTEASQKTEPSKEQPNQTASAAPAHSAPEKREERPVLPLPVPIPVLVPVPVPVPVPPKPSDVAPPGVREALRGFGM